jgi:DNA-binding LacI/PurR family transcriptional regulator
MTTLRDVAKLAGVSTSTVSRALSRPELVNRRTRARVEEASRALGYSPSRVARRLRVERGRANLVGLIIPDLQNPFFAELARGVEDAAQRHGFTVLIGNSDEEQEKERRYLQVMQAESVDGVILPPISERDPAAMELVRSGMPVVLVDRKLADARTDTVVADNVGGAYQATEHLLGLGHLRIGFIEGRPEVSTSRERLEGYARALASHGIEVEPELVRAGDSRQQSGRRLATELLELSDSPTAMLVGNSLMTLGAVESIQRKGLRIPEDVALVGYDDMPWALAMNPPLTVVRQPGYELGHRAMELLLARVENPDRSTVMVVLEPELVVRRSCGSGVAAS